MKCEICDKGPTDPQPTTVFRQNEFGRPGIWRCREHNQKLIDTEVEEIVQILDPTPPPVTVALDPRRLLEQVDDSALWKVLNEADEHKAHWSADAWRQWFVQLVDAASELSCRLEDPDFVVRLRGEATVRPVEE